MEEKDDLHILVNKVIESGDRTAIRKLGKAGAAGIEATLKGMQGPYPTERHPIDIMADFQTVFSECAKFNIQALKEVIEKDEITPDPEMILIVSALRSSPQKKEVAKILIPVLKHSNPEVRNTAAGVLIKTRDTSTIKPLTEALRDRSFSVKSTIVSAMKKNSFFRNQNAIKYLKKITSNKMIKKHDLHLYRNAQRVIDLTEVGPESKDQHEIFQLIEQVTKHTDKESEIKLASFGDKAVLAITDAISDLYLPKRTWNEASDNLKRVLRKITKNDPESIIEIIKKNEIPYFPHLWILILSLPAAEDTDLIADTLLLTLRHQDDFIRENSARILSSLEIEKTAGPLIQALDDESSHVRKTIMQSMQSNSFLRRPEAIEPLEKIVAGYRNLEWYERVGEVGEEVLNLIKKEQNKR